MYKDLFDLKNKVAIVTGCCGGLGIPISTGLAEFGAKVVLVDIDKSRLLEIENKIRKISSGSFSILSDISDYGDINKIVRKTLKKFSRIDILVNSAGILRRELAENITEEQWDEVIDINLKAAFLICQSVGKIIIKQKSGKIINIASVAGKIGLPRGNANYAASKGELIALSRTLAVEWAKYGVLVNCISPSQFHTPIIDNLLKDKSLRDSILDRIPLGRIGEPHEIVVPVIFLASKASDMITGINLLIDGGLTSS